MPEQRDDADRLVELGRQLTVLRKRWLALALACLPLTAARAQLVWGSAQQTIYCFGVAPGNAEQISMSGVQADLLFSQGVGIGLSCARLRLGSYGAANSSSSQDYFGAAGTIGDSATAIQNTLLAQARGAQVFASSWSCPASMKSGGSTVGGTLTTPGLTACANYYVSAIQAAGMLGVNITGIEYQNEPNASVSYESTSFTPSQLVTFMNTAGPIIRATFPSMKFVVSSSQDWQNSWAGTGYIPAILADATAPIYTDYLGVHTYGSPDVSGAPGTTSGKPILVTEMSSLSGAGDASMSNALTVVGWLVDSLGTGHVSGWLYWQWQSAPSGNDNQGLFLHDGTITKRIYAFGNITKFIRPGMVIYSTPGTPPTGVDVIAAKDPVSNNIAIVARNTNVTSTALTVALDPTSKCKVAVPWVTDAARNLVAGTPIVLDAAKVLSATLAASSVTTFSCVGT